MMNTKALPVRIAYTYQGIAPLIGKSAQALRQQAKRGSLPLKKYPIGNLIAFDLDQVEAWIAAGMPSVWPEGQEGPEGQE